MQASALNRLLEFDAPTIGNGIELMGFRDPTIGYTGPDIRALMSDMGPRIGVAVTARLDTTTGGRESVDNDLYYEWLARIQEVARDGSDGPLPVFAVVESVGPRPRYTVTIGDGMGTTLRLAGATAFLTNGSIRDIEGVRNVPLACWAAGLSPMHGRLRWLDAGSPVVIDGMTVRTGDVIHADENGALVIPPEAVEGVYEQAQAVRAREAAMFAKLRQPGLTLDSYLQSLGRAPKRG